jgi:hypothetical protein
VPCAGCDTRRNRPLEVAKELGLPGQVFFLSGPAAGGPDAAAVDLAIGSYDELIASFSHSQQLPPARWTERTGARGRDKLREQRGVRGLN